MSTQRDRAGLPSRCDIENTHYTANGVILQVGEFYGEAVYVPYFWQIACRQMHDFHHKDGRGVLWSFTKVTEDMRVEFPELRLVREVGVAATGGTVVSWTLSVHGPRPI